MTVSSWSFKLSVLPVLNLQQFVNYSLRVRTPVLVLAVAHAPGLLFRYPLPCLQFWSSCLSDDLNSLLRQLIALSFPPLAYLLVNPIRVFTFNVPWNTCFQLLPWQSPFHHLGLCSNDRLIIYHHR